MERLKTILEFCNTSHQFLNLEKIEVGGMRGKLLTESVRKIFIQFKEIYAMFGLKTYDSLDPKDLRFLKDYDKFNCQIWMLDRKLGAILSRAFDDCIGSEAIFKLLSIFGNLVKRGLIALELSDKMPLLVVKLNEEMDDSKRIFNKQRGAIKNFGKPKTEKNMPIVSGQLKFAHELRTKITKRIMAFKNIGHPICYSPGADVVFKKYKKLNAYLTSYEDDVFKTWATYAETKSLDGLERPLLIRSSDKGTLKVNFGKDTMAILMEVKHIQKDFTSKKVPENAKNIFKKFEDFRSNINCLDRIVDLYNYLKTDTSEYDVKLIAEEIDAIDQKLLPMETFMNWKTDKTLEYVENLSNIVSELNERVRLTQDNVIKIYKKISQWEGKPLFERVNLPGEESLLDLNTKDERKSIRYEEIKNAALEIKELINHNEKLFEVDLGLESSKRAWNMYLRYVDSIVSDSLLKTIAVSLGYLLDETDVKKNPAPLFAAKLALCEPDIIFQPSLEREIVGNFYDQSVALVDDIFKMASLVPRISKQKTAGKDYHQFALDHDELKRLKETYTKRVDKVITKAKEQAEEYLEYSSLWLNNRQMHLYYFLHYSRQLSPQEIEKLDNDEKSIRKKFPILSQFKEQIDYFENLHEEMKQMNGIKIMNSWFRVDISPFKMTILTNIKKWSYLFKKNLLDHVIDSLEDLDSFIERADQGLMIQLHPGDYPGLIKVMGFLKELKDRQSATDEMFEPLN